METIRKPYQGVWNIIRFNWHFYIVSIGLAAILIILSRIRPEMAPEFIVILMVALLSLMIISLATSHYIYDLSGLYSLQWLDKLPLNHPNSIVNVNAGFDETSSLLEKKYSNANLSVLDFYNSEKHTEVSIKRARKAYPPYPGTRNVTTEKIPLADNSIDIAFAFLSAHEIRNDEERVTFFKELGRVLAVDGKIVVTEHLRDIPNFVAYTIGFLHFHSKKTWLKTFERANLNLLQEIKITPFLTTFVLQNA